MSTEFASKVPRCTYAATLNEQLEQLRTDELMLRFAESRKRLSSDPQQMLLHVHFVSFGKPMFLTSSW